MSQPEMAVGAVPVARTRRFPLVHALLLAATALTTAMASTLARGFDPIADPRQLIHGIPFAATLITILLVHESGHYLMCRRYGVAASLPYFIPGLPPVGTFGGLRTERDRGYPREDRPHWTQSSSPSARLRAAGPWAAPGR